MLTHIVSVTIILITTLSTSDRKQRYDTPQIKLDCSPWFSSRDLSQRHSQDAQADITLVSKMRQTLCLYQSSFQRDGAATVLHQLLDAGHWRKLLHLIILEVFCYPNKSYSAPVVACYGLLTPLMPHSSSHCGDNSNPICVSVHTYMLLVNAEQWDGSKKTAVVLRIVLLTSLACRESHSKLRKAMQQKGKCFTLPVFLFGLWIKLSPGLGGGATSCPCLANKGSYSFPS